MTPTIGWLMTVVAVVAITALALSIRRSRRGPPTMNGSNAGPQQPSLITVSVEMECKDDHSFKVKVDPWSVRVKSGLSPEVEWKLDGPQGSTMEIEPKDSGNWPLDKTPPLGKVPPNHPLKGGKVSPGAPPGKYDYSIVLTCKDSQGHDRAFDIDPDIYILV